MVSLSLSLVDPGSRVLLARIIRVALLSARCGGEISVSHDTTPGQGPVNDLESAILSQRLFSRSLRLSLTFERSSGNKGDISATRRRAMTEMKRGLRGKSRNARAAEETTSYTHYACYYALGGFRRGCRPWRSSSEKRTRWRNVAKATIRRANASKEAAP